MPYPPHVPIFSAEDICKGAFERGSQCDATRWLSSLFGYSTPEYKVAYLILVSIIDRDDKSPLYAPEVVGELTALILWNESSRVSRAYIAQCLNRTMRRLGYTEEFWIETWEFV